MKSEATRRDEDSGVYRSGLAAYDRGDWKEARRLLRDAAAGRARKQDRVHAGRLLESLSPDRFALGLAAILFLLFLGLAGWVIL